MRMEMRNGNDNVNENVNVSIVNEVIRTIFFFFLRENFISIESTKRHI